MKKQRDYKVLKTYEGVYELGNRFLVAPYLVADYEKDVLHLLTEKEYYELTEVFEYAWQNDICVKFEPKKCKNKRNVPKKDDGYFKITKIWDEGFLVDNKLLYIPNVLIEIENKRCLEFSDWEYKIIIAHYNEYFKFCDIRPDEKIITLGIKK